MSTLKPNMSPDSRTDTKVQLAKESGKNDRTAMRAANLNG